MQLIADLHIHSRYARACSKDLTLENLERYARLKGIDLLGTGDFQHPRWRKDLDTLTEDQGLLRSAGGFPFLLQTEISLAFTQGGHGRRVHLLLLAPDLATADQVIEALKRRGRVDYDGRPIFGFSCIELVEMMRAISHEIEVVPAHAWTPYFGVFGSKTGFDTLADCFGDQTKHVHAIETGLSSDPAMNWRLSMLDGIQLLSFSDAHSFWPHRLGREVTMFEVKDLRSEQILRAIRTGDGLVRTIEVDPAYGKYHWDGHRDCNIVLSPDESRRHQKICPACKRPLTIGVEHRVTDLADRPPGTRPAGAKPFTSLMPLSEILALATGTQPFSRGVQERHARLVAAFGNEFRILLDTPQAAIAQTDPQAADLITRIREGKVTIRPGYDGVYGEPVLDPASGARATPKRAGPTQTSLTHFGSA
ncbi:MAG: DNA helicase UvrD [Candidatus Aenigmarchaeota archaeon]|nr:DNA helicase UvrD [Candidatus Aenigmarchaeota archaeon]